MLFNVTKKRGVFSVVERRGDSVAEDCSPDLTGTLDLHKNSVEARIGGKRCARSGQHRISTSDRR